MPQMPQAPCSQSLQHCWWALDREKLLRGVHHRAAEGPLRLPPA